MVSPRFVGNRYNAKTKRLERECLFDHRVVDVFSETDYIVVASTRFDPKVDAAIDSGLEIDQVGSHDIARHGVATTALPPLYGEMFFGRAQQRARLVRAGRALDGLGDPRRILFFVCLPVDFDGGYSRLFCD